MYIFVSWFCVTSSDFSVVVINQINHDNLHPINRTSRCQIIFHPSILPISCTPLLRLRIIAHHTVGNQRFCNYLSNIQSISALRYSFLHVVIRSPPFCGRVQSIVNAIAMRSTTFASSCT